jgi:hypothetical protein
VESLHILALKFEVEAVLYFQAGHAEGSLSKFDPLRLTVPKSPQLSTAYRARPKRYGLSHTRISRLLE